MHFSDEARDSFLQLSWGCAWVVLPLGALFLGGDLQFYFGLSFASMRDPDRPGHLIDYVPSRGQLLWEAAILVLCIYALRKIPKRKNWWSEIWRLQPEN